MTEQEIREMIYLEGKFFKSIAGEVLVNKLAKALHQKFAKTLHEQYERFDQATDRMAELHKQALIDARIEELDKADVFLHIKSNPEIQKRIAQLKKEREL